MVRKSIISLNNKNVNNLMGLKFKFYYEGKGKSKAVQTVDKLVNTFLFY